MRSALPARAHAASCASPELAHFSAAADKLLRCCCCHCCCRRNEAVLSSAAAMLQLYRSAKEAVIHNDLHAGGGSCTGAGLPMLLLMPLLATRQRVCRCCWCTVAAGNLLVAPGSLFLIDWCALQAAATGEICECCCTAARRLTPPALLLVLLLLLSP